MRWALVCVALIGPPFGSAAAGIAESFEEEPKLDRTTSRPFYEIERCLVLGDFGTNPPSVYRAPDQPDESLLYFSLGIGNTLVLKLNRVDTVVRVRLWEGGARIRQEVEKCL